MATSVTRQRVTVTAQLAKPNGPWRQRLDAVIPVINVFTGRPATS